MRDENKNFHQKYVILIPKYEFQRLWNIRGAEERNFFWYYLSNEFTDFFCIQCPLKGI